MLHTLRLVLLMLVFATAVELLTYAFSPRASLLVGALIITCSSACVRS